MKISILKALVFALSITLFVFDNGCDYYNPLSPSRPDFTSNLRNSPATLADSIPYSALGSGKIAFERINNNENYFGGYVIDVDSQKSNLFMDGSGRMPSISPDGSLIAFVTSTMNNYYDDIYVINSDGSNKTRLSGFEDVSQDYPSWRLDGSIIYSVINMIDTNFASDIYSQKPGDNSAVKIFSVPYSIGEIITSPISVLNSERYLFCTFADTSIFVYENSMIREIKPNYNSLSNRLVQINSPKWAPNESEIACMITEMDSVGMLYKISIIKMNSDGSNLKVLAAFDFNTYRFWADFSLCWSPDGSKILFNLIEGDFISHIYVMNADGSQITQVTTMPGVFDGSVSWSN